MAATTVAVDCLPKKRAGDDREEPIVLHDAGTAEDPPRPKRAKDELWGHGRTLSTPSEFKDLSPAVITKMVADIIPKLVEIKQEKVHSRRHEIYVYGIAKQRNALKHNSFITNWLTQEQFHQLSWYILSEFHCKDTNLFSYVMDVLLPEAMIRLISICFGIGLAEAEARMNQTYTLPSHDSDDTENSNEDEEVCIEVLEPPPNELTKEEIQAVVSSCTEENVIGKGAFGSMHRGVFNGKNVAIKVLNDSSETVTFVLIWAYNHIRLRHPNLIQLLGYSCHPPFFMYPFMVLSLYRCLHTEEKLKLHPTWDQRVMILKGTGRALEYLHSSSFVHQNVKSLNILLDESLHPKLGDFGLAPSKPMYIGSTHILPSKFLSRNRGYTAPEYTDGKLTPKADVYSYGVVCLETYTSLLPFSNARDEENLVDHCHEGRFLESIDMFKEMADLQCGIPSDDTVNKIMKITQKCVHKNYKKRCTMEDVMEMWK